MSTLGLASAHRTAHVAPRGANLRRPSAAKRRAPPPLSQRRPRAVAVDASVDSRTQADFDALWAWLGSEGVDVSKVSPAMVDAAPGGRGWGLVAAEDIGGGEAVLAIPRSLWMTVDTALASPIGAHCGDEAGWIAVALQLLHERSIGDKSRWAAYVNALPAQLDAPLFWSAEEVAELTGTQLLDAAAGYDSYVRGTWSRLKESAFDANPEVFPSDAFDEASFLWAFGILRSRCQAPVDQGADIALVPGLDMANHSGLSSQTWTLNNGGVAAVFGGGKSGGSMLLRTEKGAKGLLAKGAEVFMNYGQRKIDNQLALDYGFTDAFASRPGYVLGPIAIPESDPNAFDKMDVLEVAGLKEAPSFVLRAFEDPEPELRVFMRLLNLKGEDSFLLEAIFRQEAWGLVSEPVSQLNEQEACGTMINGCEEALRGYATRVEDDRKVAEDPGAGHRLRLAARVRMGEKQALADALGFFSGIEARLDSMEYYQERRLRSLNLLDKDGNSTYDPFQDTMA